MTLDSILDQVTDLPPAPQILPTLLSLLGDEESDPGEIVDLLRVDVTLTAQILKLANSAFFGMSTKASSLEEAVGRIGFQEVYKMVAVICGSDMFNGGNEAYSIEPGKLWENSVAGALVMEAMAAEAGEDTSSAYTVGLLHSIGKMVINQIHKGSYHKVFDVVESTGCSLIQAEREVIGFDHAQIGAALLERWKFPAAIREPVEYQYRPLEAPVYTNMACMLHIANWIGASVGLADGRNVFAFEVEVETLERLRFGEEHLQRFILETHGRIDQIAQLLKATSDMKKGK